MAKKGVAQQLQADIQTDEDFDKFLERPGLLVLDVYSEWCGPCLGMVGSLRKIKLEVGGDNLQLAICKSDTITALKRFNKKSEPTWLFVSQGKAVNIMYGTDVPKLVALITKELEKTIQKIPRLITYEISELQPIEVENLRVKTEAIEKAERIEREAKHKKLNDYLTHVTDIIMDNMPDIGVTVFGPQVNRDMFKKLTEPAEPLKMQCKDRKVAQVFIEQFATVNFACKNPLPEDVIEQLDGKELLMCFWKVDESVGSVANVLMAYAHELTKERVAPPDDMHDEEHVIPPIISPLKVKIEVEVQEGEVWAEEVSSSEENLRKIKQGKSKSVTHMQDEAHPEQGNEEAIEDYPEEEGSEEEIGEPHEAILSYPSMPFDMDLDLGDDIVEEEEEEKEEELLKILTRTKTVKLPAVWVPNNRRTHAALIYVFFRGQTTGFLPPDPKPEPPHVIMAFDASKRREIMHVVERHLDDVPLFGYFRSDNPEETELIANSSEKYDLKDQMPTDKIVLKVNKVQSNMMLSLVSYGPSYVSPNTTVGRDEALKFFPEDYKLNDDLPPTEKKKKSKKGKKTEEMPDSREGSVAVPEKISAEQIPEQLVEGGPDELPPAETEIPLEAATAEAPEEEVQPTDGQTEAPQAPEETVISAEAVPTAVVEPEGATQDPPAEIVVQPPAEVETDVAPPAAVENVAEPIIEPVVHTDGVDVAAPE